uniref:DNA primase n=1 Tax=viral metagenome TaxID=1070528 RepID=A0A6M3IEB5_9ZZZZ
MTEIKYVGRISLDYDSYTELPTAIRALLKLYFDRNVRRVGLYSSASGRGLHILATLNKPITVTEQLRIRQELGDCKDRVKFSKKDLKKGFNPDVLFTHKKVNGKWKKEQLIIQLKG